MTENEKKEDAAPKKGKGLMIGIIVAALAAAGGGWFFFLKDKAATAEAVAEAEAPEEGSQGGGDAHGAAQSSGGSMFSLEPFIVNLQDNSGTRYLKLTINLELSSASTSELVSQAARIRDSLIILLSSKSYSDIGTVEGKYQMRDEIIARVNQFLTKSKVKTAYFTEFVIQ